MRSSWRGRLRPRPRGRQRPGGGRSRRLERRRRRSRRNRSGFRSRCPCRRRAVQGWALVPPDSGPGAGLEGRLESSCLTVTGVFGRKKKPKLGPGKKQSGSAWSGKSTSSRWSRSGKSAER